MQIKKRGGSLWVTVASWARACGAAEWLVMSELERVPEARLHLLEGEAVFSFDYFADLARRVG